MFEIKFALPSTIIGVTPYDSVPQNSYVTRSPSLVGSAPADLAFFEIKNAREVE
ncbi:MAG: hypothetical protein U1F40_00600 [Turneriella sp.]